MAQFKVYNTTIYSNTFAASIIEAAKKAIQRELDSQRIQGDNPWEFGAPQLGSAILMVIPEYGDTTHCIVGLEKCGRRSYRLTSFYRFAYLNGVCEDPYSVVLY